MDISFECHVSLSKKLRTIMGNGSCRMVLVADSLKDGKGVASLTVSGDELDMGFSPFRKSNVEIYWMFAKKKLGFKLSKEQKSNRKLLADAMVQAGFIPLSFEWWHFNGMPKEIARKKYKIIE